MIYIANQSSCHPLKYEGDIAMNMHDGDEHTCMEDTLESHKQYRITFRKVSTRPLQMIKIIGYGLDCSQRGLLVIYSPFCLTNTGCDPPHQICISQHRAKARGSEGLMLCSYMCRRKSQNGLFAISKPASRNMSIRLCEVIVE